MLRSDGNDLALFAVNMLQTADYIQELEDENEALKKDSERLEWLAKSGARVYRRTERSGYIVMNPCHDLLGKQDHDDWRDAIDEAMRGRD
jgi:hypothetical protein